MLLRTLLLLTFATTISCNPLKRLLEEKTENYIQLYWYDMPTYRNEEESVMCLNISTNTEIYCKGPILEAVNYHNIYNDSKDFVDSVLLQEPEVINQKFKEKFGENPNITLIDRGELNEFITTYFNPPESELDVCEPEDWVEQPTKIIGIQDDQLREWALNLHGIWKTLCRKVKQNLFAEKSKHSLLFVKNPFIIPGGRFREFYYWDTYWIIKGLLVSGMHQTSKYMLENLLDIVKDYGFVPNGGRIYYTRRSQPPTLIPSVYQYYQSTGDKKFVEDHLATMEKEFKFWCNNRMKSIELGTETVRAYFYDVPTNVPRPESFAADVAVTKGKSEQEQQFYYRAAASAAESGWDFSSRWFADKINLATMETHLIAPVDLNAFLCYNMDILGYLYEVAGNTEKADYYQKEFEDFRKTFEKVFYNSSQGAWYDYNTRTESHNLDVYPSIATPLFTGCYNRLDESKSVKLFERLGEAEFFKFPGGIPTSMNNKTGQQWDFPNGWSPINHMVIEGLRKSTDPIMQDKAYEIASRWLMGNYKVYEKSKQMFEKYNVIGDVPEPGHGGEYQVQTGFGWSNGVVLDILSMYYDRIHVPKAANSEKLGLVIPALTLMNLYFQLA